MTVRCKFKVVGTKGYTTYSSLKGGTVMLHPVTSGSKENEAFFNQTPWGQFEMGTINEEAFKQFNPGDEFYVDLTKIGV